MKKQLLLLLLSVGLLINAVRGQEPAPTQTPTTSAGVVEVEDNTPIKVETLLLTVPLTVSERSGRNVPGLKKENFSILQNGDPQDIEFFFNEEEPMNVAILLDTSFSTKAVLD